MKRRTAQMMSVIAARAALCAATVLCATAVNAGLPGDLTFDTIVQARIGLGHDAGTVSLGEVLVTPSLSGWLGQNVYFKSSLRARADLPDRLEPGRPGNDFRGPASQRAIVGTALDIELRDFYFDIEFDDHVLRLGKQQIVWGEADGLKVLDVVNPQSFREFILPDFDDSRIPLWAANLELALNAVSTLQLVWLPDHTYHDIPDPGARFAFTTPLLVPDAPAGTPVLARSPRRPGRVLADSDAGLRFATFRDGWELSLNYLYHYDDTPALRVERGNSGVVITPTYGRTHLAGGTFNYAAGAFVARGELGYSSARPVRRRLDLDPDGVFTSDELAWVLGLDYDGIRDTFVSAQVFQSALLDYRPGTVRDKLEQNVTLLVHRDFRNETLTAELLAIHGLNDSDGVVQFELFYDWRSNIEISVGADIFYGTRDGIFGQFKQADRLTFGIEIGF